MCLCFSQHNSRLVVWRILLCVPIINWASALSDLRRIDVKQKVYVYSKEDSLVGNTFTSLIYGSSNQSIILGRGRVRYIYENMWATVDFLDGTVSKEIYNNEVYLIPNNTLLHKTLYF